jgi:lipoic acid synthetase
MLRVRWLGRVRYRDAYALQRGLFERSPDDHLLLLEHPHVFTLGVRADPAHILVDAADVNAEVVRTDRGGDVTYHGPGQLVGYPIVTLPPKNGVAAPADTVAYVRSVEQLLIDVLGDLGLPGAARLDGYPGVWVDVDSDAPRKIAAIGVKVSRDRTMHGFALNVAPDLAYFGHVVPCGISDKGVTSMAAEGVDVDMVDVVDAVVARATAQWGAHGVERLDVIAAQPIAVRTKAERRADAGVVQTVEISERKPAWTKARVRITDDYLQLKTTMRDLSLTTVCEEAGCPNIFECWGAGTATFMINGERCTRACGFCLVDTRHPEALDAGESARVAEAVDRMGLAYAVVTAVARDDLDDGGAEGFVATIDALRTRTPQTRVEVLIPDCKGDPDALATIFAAQPDVLNHNVETVPRLQRLVRPNASYARSLAVLTMAKDAGLVTKSGLIVGLGEDMDEVLATLADLNAIGVDIVTVGQYLRPTAAHLPVARWWTPDEFEAVRVAGEAMGIAHVEASPLTRSSHHAAEAAAKVLDLVLTRA